MKQYGFAVLCMAALVGCAAKAKSNGMGPQPGSSTVGVLGAGVAGNGATGPGATGTPTGGGTGATGGGISPTGGGTGATGGGIGATAGGSGSTGGGGSGTPGGGGGTGGAPDVVPPPPPGVESKGCGDTKLLSVPDDTSARGPWPVGEKTVKFDRFTAVDIMYPAKVGSEVGQSQVSIDLRSWLPPSEAAKISDAAAKSVEFGSFKDLELDATHGPYPVVILVHGTGAFRVASGLTQAQWASRGFVVIAADHPNLFLTDMIVAGCGMTAPGLDLNADVDAEIAAVNKPAGDLAFLAGHVDTTRIALAGHSAGAFNVAQFTNKPNVQVVILLAGTHDVAASSTLKSVLFIGGMADSVLTYTPPATGIGGFLYPGTQTEAYMGSPAPKHLVGITGGGHLAVTDLCQNNAMGMNAIEVAMANGVCGLGLLPSLFDCGTVDRLKGTAIVNAASTAALEETLHCLDRSAQWAGMKAKFPEIGDFQEMK
jgi:hypothetical protein